MGSNQHKFESLWVFLNTQIIIIDYFIRVMEVVRHKLTSLWNSWKTKMQDEDSFGTLGDEGIYFVDNCSLLDW
jgi:hypothetical protein